MHITETNRILNSTNKTKSEKCANNRDEQDTQQLQIKLSQKRVHITETNRILNSTNKTKSEKSAHNRDEQDTQQHK